MSPSPPNTLKRKERPDDEEDVKPTLSNNGTAQPPLPSGAAHARQDEYEAGRVICEGCGAGVCIRDESTGAFTVNHWEAHRQSCAGGGDSMVYAPTSPVEGPSQQTKRRRAKRTEEERIEYLRADQYVAQFEAYRVLCASCDKWIRLRPNSTYCSIPWDAHRKSCLAKKINNKNVYALEERNSILSKDPDVRKFDPERILCNMCDKWIAVPADDHLQAVQKWLQHRDGCQRSSGAATAHAADVPAHPPPTSATPSLSPSAQGGGQGQAHRSSFSSNTSPMSPKGQPMPTASSSQGPQASSSRFSGPDSQSFHDLNPNNFAPAHESRRRNAEQRAATLRADRLIGEVEPNRVFCTLCKKWVQLRQDSSYCAYPWLQHRGKCLARHQRRMQKIAEIAELKARKMHGPMQEEDELMSDVGDSTGRHDSDDLESEDGMDAAMAEEEFQRRKEAKRNEQQRRANHNEGSRPSTSSSSRSHHNLYHPYYHSQRQSHVQSHHKSRSVPYPSGSRYPAMNGAGAGPMAEAHRGGGERRGTQSHSQSQRPSQRQQQQHWDEHDLDAEGEPDAEGEYVDEEHIPPPPPISRAATGSSRSAMPTRRPWPVGLADLDSASGRKQFIFGSVEYLFATTYEATDDMSISALVAYLNAAIPMDKHEDFDTTEVVKAVTVMKEKGRVILEGDILRLVD
ncbi:hypothetical protein CPC08DRAFT_738417 [Agrocybe pediades]|nr:hypothetical protein CPC08DRAFT_738417 [Agrocybe pediades]